jgi:predicted transcriptional regulator
MKTELVTIRLDHELNLLLTRISQSTGKNKSDIIRQALVRQLRIDQFEEIRRQVLPFADAQGLLTDEEVFSQVS